MQHLEVSGAVVLYIGRTVSKGKTKTLKRHVVYHLQGARVVRC
jgi:hypothetical protein